MTKRTIIPLLIAALVALLLPWLAVTFAKGDNGMAVIFLLFFAVNPITAVLLGVFSGGNVRMAWFQPLLFAALFLLDIRFEVADMRTFHRDSPYGQLVTNPPYGQRLMEKQEAEELYREFGKVWRRLPEGWRTLVLSSHTEFERTFGQQAAKKRKLYNGMIKCDVFMYGNKV